MSDDHGTQKATVRQLQRIELRGARVEVTQGPDAGREATVGAAGVVIGTGVDCDLRLGDDLVSRRHLELRPSARALRLIDLGSTNGTFVGQVRIADAMLEQDATVVLGGTTLAVHLGGGTVIDVSERLEFGKAIAHSPAMRHVFALLERAARGDVTILLEGESGTGKEVLARAVHDESARAAGPFVVVDCGAIPENLVESELFGHEKGAFTGADRMRPGAFEQANGGTVFLDEIGELPIEAQPKLLRALESRAFRRVGGTQTVNVDVRVVAATNRKLREAVRQREFREDLFYRLAVVHISVPRLADRPEDIIPLAESFLRNVTRDADASVPAELVGLLGAYPWPGNARELRNVIERFATFERADPALLFGDHAGPLPTDSLDLASLMHLPYETAKQRLLDVLHRQIVPRVVERAGSVPRAAEILNVPRSTLYRILQQTKDEDRQ